MGKKGSWFNAIKRAFSPHSKEKLANQETERKSVKEKKKKGLGKKTNSFLPIFREPSSIEKILGEAERDHNLVFRPPSPPLRPTSPHVPSPRVASPRATSPRANLPRSLSTKSNDRSKPSSASANAPAITRVPSQRNGPPIVPSPRVASPQTVVPPKPPSPRGEPPTLDTPRPSSPKPPSQREVSPRAPSPKPLSQREVSPRPPSPKPLSQREVSPRPPSPRTEPPRLDAPRPTTPKPPSPREASPRVVQQQEIVYNRPEPTLLVQHASATKIQTAYRGYTARKSFRALKGLVRLQGVVKGYGVKRQTINAMKYMQKLVRVQSQIQSRRIKTLEVEKDEAVTESGNDNWDDSVLTKEEKDARSQRKIDAIIKRERSMAYAYSHKNSPKSVTLGGLSPWWNRQFSPLPSHKQTPSRLSPSPLSHHFNNYDASTPKSSRSTLLTPSRPSRYSRLRGQDSPFKDDGSLTSCPPFPSYMAPTVSAKAKVRPNSNPKERVMGTPSSVNSEMRRMSYPPMQQGHDMFRWNQGSLMMNQRGSGSPGGVVLEKGKTVKSVGNMSIGSMASTVGSSRKPFNRYV